MDTYATLIITNTHLSKWYCSLCVNNERQKLKWTCRFYLSQAQRTICFTVKKQEFDNSETNQTLLHTFEYRGRYDKKIPT